jgi:hypothetical protein
MDKIQYPIQTFESVRFFIDSGYIHTVNKNMVNKYPFQLVNDTMHIYKPVVVESGFFQETFVRTSFNDSILEVMKKYGINYPELAGTWILVREEDYDYGTHYELKFAHSIPDSIEFTREYMINALEQEKIFSMSTDGIKRDYYFWYNAPNLYFKPGNWFKDEEDPWIHFYKR